MLGAVTVAALLLSDPATAAPSGDAQEPWSGLLGSGLLTLQDTGTLAPGKFTVAFTVDNKDRDPLGLDIVDGAIAWNVGVTRWAEFYGHHVFNRSVAVPDTPLLPPPVDAIVPPGKTMPAQPYYSLYYPIPYVDDTGPIKFGKDIQGDLVLGFKARALTPSGKRPGLAATLGVQIPLTRELSYLRDGSGTGSVDVNFGAIAEWRVQTKWSLVAQTSFTHVGAPTYPDRRIELRNGSPVAIDSALVLPHRIDVGIGVRRELLEALAAVVEASTVFEVGARTPSLDPARPVDFLGGLQIRWKRLRVTAALRDHTHVLPSMEIRPSPLGGLIDVTEVSEADIARYLAAIGMSGAESLLRNGTHRLLVPPPGGPTLPAGARVIPATYRIRSEGNVGFVLLGGLSF